VKYITKKEICKVAVFIGAIKSIVAEKYKKEKSKQKNVCFF